MKELMWEGGGRRSDGEKDRETEGGHKRDRLRLRGRVKWRASIGK